MSQEKKNLPQATPMPKSGGASNKDTGFFGVLQNLASYLSFRRGQAYMGQPGSVMVWDAKRGSYVFEGVELSDDDVPDAPPPMSSTKPKTAQPQAPTEPVEAGGAADLARPAFAGALAGRRGGRGARGGRGGRAPGAGRGGAASAFGASVPPAPEEQKADVSNPAQKAELEQSTVDPALFTTAADISVSQTEEPKANEAAAARTSMLSTDPSPMKATAPFVGQHLGSAPSGQGQQQNLEEAIRAGAEKMLQEREVQWNAKYKQYQEKLKLYRERVVRFKTELLRVREENEQTIDHFTQLCQDLKIRGMDEVEELQGKIRTLESLNDKLLAEKAQLEFQNDQSQHEIERMRKQHADVISYIKSDKFTATGNDENSKNAAKLAENAIKASEELAQHVRTISQLQSTILDLQSDRETHLWQISSYKQGEARQSIVTKQMTQRLAALQTAFQQQKAQKEMFATKVELTEKDARQRIQSMKDQHEELQGVLRSQLEAVTAERDEKRTQLFEGQRKITDLQAEVTMLTQQAAIMQAQLQKRQLFQAASRMQGGSRSKLRRIRRQVVEDAGGQGDDGLVDSDSDEDLSSSLDDEEITEDSGSDDEDEDERDSDDESATEQDNELLISHQDVEEEEKEAGEEHVRMRASTITKDDRGGLVTSLNLGDELRAKPTGDTPKYVGSPDRPAAMLNRQLSSPRLAQSQEGGNTTTKEQVDGQIRAQMKLISMKQKEHKEQRRKARKEKKEGQAGQTRDSRQKDTARKGKSVQQMQREQIENQQKQIKTEFEKRLKIERDLHRKEQQLSVHKDSMLDLVNVLSSIIVNEQIKVSGIGSSQQSTEKTDVHGDQQSSSLLPKEEDGDQIDTSNNALPQSLDEEFDTLLGDGLYEQATERMISVLFEIQRHYQQKVTETQHKLSLMTLKSDQNESLALDLEIVTQERQLLEQEKAQLKSQLGGQAQQLSSLQDKLSAIMQEQAREQVRVMQREGEVERLKKDLQRSQQNTTDVQTQLQTSMERRVQETRDHYEREVLPSVQQQADRRLEQSVQRLNEQIKSSQEDATQALAKQSQLDKELSQLKEEARKTKSDLEQAQDKFKYKELEHEEAVNALNRAKQELSAEKAQSAEHIRDISSSLQEQRSYVEELQKQLQNARQDYEKQMLALGETDEKMKSQAKQMAEQLEEAKKDGEEKQNKIEAMTQEIDQAASELTNLKQKHEEAEKAKKEEQDNEFWSLVRQVSDMRAQLDAKDGELKEALASSAEGSKAKENEVEDMKRQLNQMKEESESKMALKEKEIREALEASISQMTESHKNAQADLQKKLDEARGEIDAVKAAQVEPKVEADPEMIEELNNLKTDLMSEAARSAELRNLYEYQMEINDGLNVELERSKMHVSTLQKQIEIRQEQDEKRRKDHEQVLKQHQVELAEAKKVAQQPTPEVKEQAQTEVKDEVKEDEPEQPIVVQAVEATQPTAASLFADDSDFVYPTTSSMQSSQPPAPLSMATEPENKDGEHDQNQQQIEESQKETDAERQRLSDELANSQQELTQTREQLKELQEEHGRVTEQLTAANDKAIKAEEDLQQALNNLEQANKDLAEAKQSLESANNELEELRQAQVKLDTVQADLDKANEELEKLRSKADEKQPSDTSASADLPAETAAKIAQLEQREAQYKKAAEEMAAKFKEKLTKAKDQKEQANQQVKELEKHKNELETKLTEVTGDYSKVFEQLETSKVFGSRILDVSKDDLKKQLANLSLNLSQIDDRFGELQADKGKLLKEVIQIVNESGLEELQLEELISDDFDEQKKEQCLSKLRTVLQNYVEDKRQMQALVDKNDELVKKNQQLDDANYDLRYELQEANKLVEQAQSKAEATAPAQTTAPELPQPVPVLDFDSKFEPQQDKVVAERALGGAYADMSINQPEEKKEKEKPATAVQVKQAEQPQQQNTATDKKDEERSRDMPLQTSPQKKQQEAVRRAPTPQQQKPRQEVKQQQAQGYFSSIMSSLFLTESDVAEPKDKSIEVVQTSGGDDTGTEYEYEYVEYYEETADDQR